MELSRIRNFCIIAHIDHGKSTLADRFLELTGTIAPRQMAEQVLDAMDLEREKGITIKAHPVRMEYKAADGQAYQLNLIDTPGHVDFSYEVSRALAACEGAVLVVDATQGIQAQTLANVYFALEQNLTLIPVVNKIDLSSAAPQRVVQEIKETLGLGEALLVSAKEGTGVTEVLEAVVRQVPPPRGRPEGEARALIFDSQFDPYKGVIAYVRLVDGRMAPGQRLRAMATGKEMEALEVGTFRPALTPGAGLAAGEVGYIATGLKNVKDCQVGDTVTGADRPAATALPGYRPAKPMVFAGLYPVEGGDYPLLRDALDKLKLNDSSLSYEPETSAALGFGFRCGFLGLLHMEIVRERLEREYGLSLVITAPSVAYQALKTDGSLMTVDSPARLPPPQETVEIREPWMAITIIAPSRHIGPIMELVTARRGEYKHMNYIGGEKEVGARVHLEYTMPLAHMLVDFYDPLKSLTQGYASLDYAFADYRPAPLVKLDILVNGQPVDALSTIVRRDDAHRRGKELVQKLRGLIPRQLFEVAVQAAMGGKVVARENVKAMRKDVLAKCYGGDVTRKRKLLEKQAEGKKRMKRVGNVEIPQEAFMAVLKLGE